MEVDENIYIRLNNGIIMPYSHFCGFIFPEYKIGKITDILEEGDLVEIEYDSINGDEDERDTELCLVSLVHDRGDNHIAVLTSKLGFFAIQNGVFDSFRRPVIKSIVTREKLESVTYQVDNEKEVTPSR